VEKENARGLTGHLPGGGDRRDQHPYHTIPPVQNQSSNERLKIGPQPFALAGLLASAGHSAGPLRQDRPAPAAGPTSKQLTWLARLAIQAGPRRFNEVKQRLGFPAVPAALLTGAQAGRLIAELRREVGGRR
jgi:hypothetical protein